MDVESLKGIIDELLESNKLLTLERAIARKDVKTLLARVEELEKQVTEFQANADVEVHTVTTKE